MPPSVHDADDIVRWVTARTTDAEVWVAERGGSVVAYADLEQPTTGPGWLHSLYVHPDHAHQGIVSRLDVGTSGLMVVAKSEYAYSRLKQAFRSRSVDKKYHALVQGHPDPHTGTVDAPIDRHPTSPYKFAVVQGGRDSVTHYATIEAFRHATLLDINLETGRTHQIRVHMAAIKHPCVGDVTYGADPTLAKKLGLERQWLHAVRLAFAHPDDGRRLELESPYPADLQHALDTIAALS
jgi:23S rRNA pseudouridine1911/1915/1917 synthase